MVSGDGASSGNAGFRDPAQKVELPESHVRGHEQGNQEALLVSRSGKEVSEEAV